MVFGHDETYIARVLAGDTAAYASLVQRHQRMAFTLALKITGSREDAEEVAQDAFLKAFQSLKDFRSASRFSTWLYRIVYNLAVSKTRQRRLPVVDADEALLAGIAEEEVQEGVGGLTDEEQRLLVARLLETLPPQDHLLVTLFYMESQSVEEISSITGLSKANVKVRLHRLRRKLYHDLSQALKTESFTISS